MTPVRPLEEETAVAAFRYIAQSTQGPLRGIASSLGAVFQLALQRRGTQGNDFGGVFDFENSWLYGAYEAAGLAAGCAVAKVLAAVGRTRILL